MPAKPRASTAVVIGAGIGGLAAAWRLQQAGFEVVVFERELHPGGRINSIRIGAQIIDTGATALLSAYDETLDLVRELGLENDLQAMRGHAAFPVDGHLHLIDMNAPLAALSTKMLGWRSKLALLKLAFRFLSVSKSLNFLSLGNARGKDRETLSAYCRKNFPPEVYDRLLNPAIKFLYLHNGESGSLIELLWWMKASGRGAPRSLRRGTGSLTDALASRLVTHTGCKVTRVARNGPGVSVEVQRDDGDSIVHHADVCVVTVPGTIAAQICVDGLSAVQRDFLRSRRYDRCIVVSFCTRTRPALDALMFMIPDASNADLATVIFGHHISAGRSPDDQGIVNAYFMKAWSDRHYNESDEMVVKAAQAQIKNWVHEVQDLVAWHVQRWSHPAAIAQTGDCELIHAFEAEVDPMSPIQVIGDFQAQASINVAVANANRAARRLIQRRRALVQPASEPAAAPGER